MSPPRFIALTLGGAS